MEFLCFIHKCNWDLSVFIIHTAGMPGEQLTSELIAKLDKFQYSSKAKYTDYMPISRASSELYNMADPCEPLCLGFPIEKKQEKNTCAESYPACHEASNG